MAANVTASRFQALYKAKRSPWKETLRQRRTERLKEARSARIDAIRRSVIANNELDEDLALEEELRLEQLEREFELFDTIHLPVAHPCPVCYDKMHVTGGGGGNVYCGRCKIHANVPWQTFHLVLETAHERHSRSGCVRTAEFLFFEENLFIACDTCDYMDMVCF